MNYKEWSDKVKECCRCDLCKTRTQVVVGEGNIKAPIIFVGEAPGNYEDIQGKPFVGRSGQLLRKVLSDIGLTTDDYYITNIVMCRPLDNRDPYPSELNKCGQHLIDQIKNYMTPRIIVGIGRISSGIMMNGYYQKEHHGKIFQRGKYEFMGTYHPAYILRNMSMKNVFINDLMLLRKYKKHNIER